MVVWSQCSFQISPATHLWPAVQRCWKARDTPVLFRQLSGCWHCCLPLDVSPTRPTRGLVCSRNALPYLLHCFHVGQRVRVLNQLHVYNVLLLPVLENCTLCVQCTVCSRSTPECVCQRVRHYNHVCVQTTADLLLLDGCFPVHCYRKQETEVQF